MGRCGPEMKEERKYHYKIVNKSGYQLKLVPYVEGQVEHENSIILENNQFIEKKQTSFAGGFGLTMMNFFNKTYVGNITHLEIIFDNQKKIIYEECNPNNNCNAQPRNIFNSLYNNELTETYTITPEDYQNAVDCGGNCY